MDRVGPGVHTPPEDAFTYTNEAERAPGPVLSVLSRLLPGVGRVQAQAGPFAAAWREANLRALAQAGPLWLVLGDSLSQGLGAPSPDRGWVGQTQRTLAAAGRPCRVVNLSVSGARTQEIHDRQLPGLRALESLGQRPDLVTLLTGSNDLVSRRRRDGLAQRLTDLLDGVPPGTVVATLPNPTQAARAVNALIEPYGAEHGLVVAETRDPRTTSWRGKLAEDHFHPNERGYASIAAVFTDTILGPQDPAQVAMSTKRE